MRVVCVRGWATELFVCGLLAVFGTHGGGSHDGVEDEREGTHDEHDETDTPPEPEADAHRDKDKAAGDGEEFEPEPAGSGFGIGGSAFDADACDVLGGLLRPLLRLRTEVEIVGELNKRFPDGMRIVVLQARSRACVAENLPYPVRIGPGCAINRNRAIFVVGVEFDLGFGE